MAPPILGGGTPQQKIVAWVVAGGIFAGWKWMDQQKEAKFEGDEAAEWNKKVLDDQASAKKS